MPEGLIPEFPWDANALIQPILPPDKAANTTPALLPGPASNRHITRGPGVFDSGLFVATEFESIAQANPEPRR